MIKRMTLLAKKEGMSTSDFRSYWAGPHAKLALGMTGIARYVHNRVDKVLWTSSDEPTFDVDGIVELFFADDDAMRTAQASAVGQKHIPADEPNFLKGWTLCVVETWGSEPSDRKTKVLIPFHASPDARARLQSVLLRAAVDLGHRFALNWTVSTAGRERLWAEPRPPDGFIVVWFDSVAAAHDAFDPASGLRRLMEAQVSAATAYLIDELLVFQDGACTADFDDSVG
jgi:hypothetical protein